MDGFARYPAVDMSTQPFDAMILTEYMENPGHQISATVKIFYEVMDGKHTVFRMPLPKSFGTSCTSSLDELLDEMRSKGCSSRSYVKFPGVWAEREDFTDLFESTWFGTRRHASYSGNLCGIDHLRDYCMFPHSTPSLHKTFDIATRTLF